MPNCQCSRPPGGGGECGPDQVAICEVSNGQCHTSCVRVPSGILTGGSAQECANWILGVVSGQPRLASMSITARDVQVLETGEYYDAKSRRDVHFGLPTALQGVLASLRNIEKGQSEQGMAMS
jgi:hypothetical protein